MKHMKIALIIGISGQDGSYLDKLLLEKGYEIHRIEGIETTYNWYKENACK